MVVEGFRAVGFDSSPCLAAEAAVGAVRREGRPTGRVGDLGAGFLKPVGEVLDLCQRLVWSRNVTIHTFCEKRVRRASVQRASCSLWVVWEIWPLMLR